MSLLKKRYLIATGLYCVMIFYLSSQPDPPRPSFSFPGIDKLAHGALYAGLAALLLIGIRRSNKGVSFRVQFYVPTLFTVLYGLMNECYQRFVPYRDFELADLAANALGALAVQCVLFLLVWRFKRAQTRPRRPFSQRPRGTFSRRRR